MSRITANGLELDYEAWGHGEPVLLISGLGAQRIRWPQGLIDGLVAKGFKVIAFDNRDVGLSEKCEAAGPPDMAAVIKAVTTGRKAPVSYTLSDMAADAAGLLDALGEGPAHIVGASMGGMIAQLVAADHPGHTRSLTSIMSTTGHPDLPRAKPEAMATLNERGPAPDADFEGFLDHQVRAARVNGSPAYPAPEAELRERARAYYQRCFYPVGFARQYAAVMASGHRRDKVAGITAPSLVIHGDADPLVTVEGGIDTAKHIPGCDLQIIPGMGHDLPAELIAGFVEAIAGNAARAGAKAL